MHPSKDTNDDGHERYRHGRHSSHSHFLATVGLYVFIIPSVEIVRPPRN